MKSHSKVIVIGGGIAGCSLLYHLAKLGWRDVVLIEKNSLTSGSTWHSAGLCTMFSNSLRLMKLLKYSVDLYQGLEQETGQGNAPNRITGQDKGRRASRDICPGSC